MKDPETSIAFAGVGARTETEMPEWYEAKQDVETVTTFAEAIRELPRATETTVGYENPYTGEWVEMERFNAVVEPDRLIAQASDEECVDPLFHVPMSNYAIINPVDVYGALEDVLRAKTYEGTPLSDLVFGEIRQYRGGGEIHMDIMFDGLSVTLPECNDPIYDGHHIRLRFLREQRGLRRGLRPR
ncbi:MAG: hypothetical protein ACI80F_000140 [Natronomonas sp.]|jgi:hypothetical protein